MKAIAIYEDVLAAIKIPEKDVEKVLKQELAFALYQRGIISRGKVKLEIALRLPEGLSEKADIFAKLESLNTKIGQR